MPYTRTSTRLRKDSAVVTITMQWRADPDRAGALVPIVNGLLQGVGTLADGSGAQRLELPPLREMLSDVERGQVLALAEALYARLLERDGLSDTTVAPAPGTLTTTPKATG
jgi:ribose 1,5-bisphosphokinase PhnN